MDNPPSPTSPPEPAPANRIGSGNFFVVFLLVATVGLAVLVALLAVQNRRLKAQLAGPAVQQSMPPSLSVGRALAPLEVNDRRGNPATLVFAGQAPATLVLVISGSCDYCHSMIPVWARAIEKSSNPRVRIVCVQTDATTPDRFEPMEQPWPLYGGRNEKRGWLRDLPIVPVTLILDAGGVITHTWLGRMDDTQAEELMFALIGAGSEAAPAPGG